LSYHYSKFELTVPNIAAHKKLSQNLQFKIKLPKMNAFNEVSLLKDLNWLPSFRFKGPYNEPLAVRVTTIPTSIM
jgi:hypothetical protein